MVTWNNFDAGWRRSSGNRIYAVSDGICALTFEPELAGRPHLQIHTPWPSTCDTTDMHEAVRNGRLTYECNYLEGGRCCFRPVPIVEDARLPGILVDENSPDQSDAFWDAMRKVATVAFAAARQDHDRMAHLYRCPRCKGSGILGET